MFNSILKSALTVTCCLTSTFAMANYPEKPITLIVGFSAGGGTDVMARNVVPYLEKYLGDDATIVVKNVPGASGQIGITEVAHSDPDGYTIGTYNLPGMMARTLDREAKYSAESFTYLANIVNDPNVIVTSKRSGIDNLQKFISDVKESSRPLAIGMSSLGGDDHLGLIKFEGLTDTKFNIIPFKGSSAARTAVLGGHVKAAVLNISEVTEFKDELNIIGISDQERSEFDSSVATFKEQGVDMVNGSMRGFVAPEGLPEEVKNKLIVAFEKLAKDPEFLSKMKSTANPVAVSIGEDFESLNNETYKLAKDVWEKTPWK
ncbi:MULTISPECIES: tripartite tricarboxylate transporter substrate binding protein [Vibrio]|uniref:tripartite tricarboxylate transporter substrate binding protein n=1 Tax=Vibrio TaxID=662 RepID=UPI001EFC5DF6|nr:tripartite tricarboxylate transporter substrate binding protein [Vibrio natriegens]MCG9699155.1 tripartite tricarboxylate transporter substrate binding protein [Vibrio natriegens]MEE3879312.1 tripartite tricarboxylate transporter substrate binding protein [Vibrio sp. YYF0003]